MHYYYSPTTRGFYLEEIHGDNMPADAVEITEAEHRALFDGQSRGLRIVAGPDGRPTLADPPPPTDEQLRAALTAAVEQHLDASAQALGYRDLRSAVTYADEPAVPQYQAEGLALRRWRSLVWARCYVLLDEVVAGSRPIPSASELLAELPALEL